MSYDICVFHTEHPLTTEDALERYQAYCEMQDMDIWVEPSPCIDAFLAELTARYPQPEDALERSVDDIPWSADFDISGGHVLMPMVFSWVDKMVTTLTDLARQHGLVCYDPQSNDVLTAPPGIHIDEAPPRPEVRKRRRRKRDAPLNDATHAMLRPRGYLRRRNTWRKNGKYAVIEIQSDLDDGLFEVRYRAWFKRRGSIAPFDITQMNGGDHFGGDIESLVTNFRLGTRLHRAFHLDFDVHEHLMEVEGTDVHARFTRSAWMPFERPTQAWRVSTLRQAFEDYLIPWLDRIDAGGRDLLDETGNDCERDSFDDEMKKLRTGVDACRRWREENLTEEEIIRRLAEKLPLLCWMAIALSIAMDWTIDEAKEKISAANPLNFEWDHTESMFLRALVKFQPGLRRRNDRKIEFTS